jgi:CDP-glucose 4,6-dehydratase
MESMGLMQSAMPNSSFWVRRNVLVTGHTGFKGSWLALWLSEMGARVTGVGLEPDTEPSLFHKLNLARRLEGHFISDIRDVHALAKIVQACQPQVVFHLAAQPLVRRSYEDPLGTWTTNVQGSLHILEALKYLQHSCAVVMVTTDKVYENKEWDYGYRENDRLGGHDPYSASKAAAELAIASWRSSFCGKGAHQTHHLSIATARAGNVIGGGDWAEDRIIPDAIRSLARGYTVLVRNPTATRPWQHVLEPIAGYLCLAQRLANPMQTGQSTFNFCSSFNFGPTREANRSVQKLIEEVLLNWPGEWEDISETMDFHESTKLHLQIDKANHLLDWKPRWDFHVSVRRTVEWYRKFLNNHNRAEEYCLEDIKVYLQSNLLP